MGAQRLIFNVFWILGITALIHPLQFTAHANFDILVALTATSLLFFWMFIGKKHTLQRWQGGIFVISYFAYIIYTFIRG